MELFAFIERNWQALAAAPLAFIGALLIGGFVGYRLATAHYGAVAGAKAALAEVTRERLTASQEDLARIQARENESRQEVGYLVGRLTAHGEELNAVKQQLESLPKIIVSDRPPGPDDHAPDGAIWIETSK